LQADDLKTLEALGFSLPSPAYLIGAILFGIVGYAAYRYGKKQEARNAKWLGVALMLYPYAVPQTWLLYVVGTALCIGLYVFRD
jgi:hypothetical protein